MTGELLLCHEPLVSLSFAAFLVYFSIAKLRPAQYTMQ